MRFYLLYIVLTVFTAFSGVQAAVKEGAPLYLELGEQRFVSFPGIDRYSVSGDSVHYVRIANETGLLLKALKTGTSTLYLSTEGNEKEVHLIRVVQKKSHAESASLLQALNPLRETEVIDSGNHFILRGRVKTTSEAQAISYLKENFASQIQDETRIEPNWYGRSKNELQ